MKIFPYKITSVIFFYSTFGCNTKNEVPDLLLKFINFKQIFLIGKSISFQSIPYMRFPLAKRDI